MYALLIGIIIILWDALRDTRRRERIFRKMLHELSEAIVDVHDPRAYRRRSS